LAIPNSRSGRGYPYHTHSCAPPPKAGAQSTSFTLATALVRVKAEDAGGRDPAGGIAYHVVELSQ